MATHQGSRLQYILQSAVQSVQWTYSLFWKLCPQQGALVWGDGYYNGATETGKTAQPVEGSSIQRSQQLRELYDSLLCSETNQQARRPFAALEDLTKSEWFYLVSISFSFPSGIGLPGKAWARQHYVWLTDANEANSKVFSRAILAKSAGVQTVVCIPVLEGVVELGTTQSVAEDLGLIQNVRNIFMDDQHRPKPSHSEHSTSNPTTSLPLLAMYAAAMHKFSKYDRDREEDEDGEDEDDEDAGESDYETKTDKNIHQFVHNSTTQDITIVSDTAELMQLELPEDIRLRFPDNGSTNSDSNVHMLGLNQFDFQSGDHGWPLLQPDQLSNGLQTPLLDNIEGFTKEDTHYSKTVSTLTQKSLKAWSESDRVSYSTHSAFSKWSHRNDHLLCVQASQSLLKYILFNVPFLYNKYQEGSSVISQYSDTVTRHIKSTSQDELSASHVLAERRRREKVNERFTELRSLVPFVTKMDKASVLGDAIVYLKQLKEKIAELELEFELCVCDQRSKTGDASASSSGVIPDGIRRRVGIVEGSNGGNDKVLDPPTPAPTVIEDLLDVSIIERDALLQLNCSYREGLLLEIMQRLQELRIEITGVQSSATNGVLTAELRAKVKEISDGKNVTINEVKRAIYQIFTQY